MDTPVAEGVIIGGRYRLGSRLGRGGMADVYAAQDERLARPVAVKLLRPELAADPDLRRRFEGEARAAARLSHPNVVAVHDTGEDAGRAFIVMERLPGDTLADRIAEGPVDQGWLKRIILEVLAALGAAHAASVIHRDVKPGNILLSADDWAKVADFGIAKTIEPIPGQGSRIDADLTVTGMIIGTPAYLAPERIDGRPASPQSDLYAVGVVMYEALTGKKPFAGTTPLAIAYGLRHEPPPDPRQIRPDADPRMVAVIGQAMKPDPAARFDSAGAMMTALAGGPVPFGGAAAAGPDARQATQLPPVGAGMAGPRAAPTAVLANRNGSPVRRRRGLAALVGAGVVAVAVALLLLAGRHLHSTPLTTGTTTAATAPPSSTAPTTTAPTTAATTAAAPAAAPTDAAGDQLRQLAAALTPADGSAASRLESGLLQVAAQPAGSQQRSNAASRLLAQANGWYQQGQLDPTAYGQVVTALQAAGATSPSPAGPPTTKRKKGGGGGGG